MIAVRDEFWRGVPEPIQAWAALTRDGNLMPSSIRDRPEDVRRACGECVPVRVLITYMESTTYRPPAVRAKLRPANYLELEPREQWEIDKRLGILDWDGT
jgi:hypothetical protein